MQSIIQKKIIDIFNGEVNEFSICCINTAAGLIVSENQEEFKTF